jgi:pimeloyl-ACP methyl ester carboxylesterase
MSVSEGTVDSDGVAIHYFDWGGAGPPVLLLHATGFLAALWRPIAERLANRFRVVAVDQRGHGDSDNPPNGYRFEVFAADLQRVVEALDLEAPLAVGHSAGGTTIVAHAAQHPGVVRRAVLIEPILPRPEWYARPAGEMPSGRNTHSLAEGARKRRAVWPGRDELFRAYRSRPTFQTWREDVLRLYVEEGTRPRDDGQVELKCPPEIEGEVFEAARYVEPWPMLGKLQCPVLVMWGENSHLHALGVADQLEEALPNSRTEMMADTTHFLPQERPDEVAGVIEQFLSDGSPDPSGLSPGGRLVGS